MTRDIRYPVPVTVFHGFVRHQLQERAAFVEVINFLLQLVECLPLLQSFRQLSAPNELREYSPSKTLKGSLSNRLLETYGLSMGNILSDKGCRVPINQNKPTEFLGVVTLAVVTLTLLPMGLSVCARARTFLCVTASFP